MNKGFLLLLISFLISIQNSNAGQPDEQFCKEWSKYIDAYDMIPSSRHELPYGMTNGDLVKGAMSFSQGSKSITVFVPEPSELLLKSWPDTDSKNKLVKTLDEYYEAKKDYNGKVEMIYKGKKVDEAIKILQAGKLKKEEDRIIYLAAELKKISLGDSLKTPITSSCFNSYQMLSLARITEASAQESKYAIAIRSLAEDLDSCQHGDFKISDIHRNALKTIDELVEQVLKREERKTAVQK